MNIKIITSFFLFIVTYYTQNQNNNQCSQRCLQCDQKSNKCLQCSPGFTYKDDINSCQSKCKYGLYYQEETDSCVSSCPIPQINDDITLECRNIEQCPFFEDVGQQYFNQFTNSLVVEDQIFTTGRNSASSNYSIKIFDTTEIKLIGTMEGHTSEIIDIKYFDNRLVSFSRNQIIIWDLTYGYIVFQFKISSPYFINNYGQTNLKIYLDDKYVVLNQQDDRVFGLFNYIEYRKASKDPKQINVHLSKYVIQFEQRHPKTIKGYLKQKQYIISFCEQSIYQWDPLQKSEKLRCYVEQQKIKNIVKLNDSLLFILFIDSTGLMAMVDTNECFLQKEFDGLTIDDIQIYSTSIFFIRTQESVVLYQLNIKNNQNSKTIVPILDYNTLQTIEDKKLMLIRLSIPNYLLTLDPVGFMKIYQITIDIETINQGKVLVQIGNHNFVFTTNMFITNVIMNIQKNNIVVFGKQVFSIEFNFNKDSKFQNQKIQKSIPKQKNSHTDKITGILIDELQLRIISYSDDGCFKVWQLDKNYFDEPLSESSSDFRTYDKVNFIMEQYHPNCDPFNLEKCKYKIIQMEKVLNDKTQKQNLITQYNDQTIVIWQYNIYDIKKLKTLELSDKRPPFNNVYIDKFQNKVTYSNSQEIKVCDINTLTIYTEMVKSLKAYTMVKFENGILLPLVAVFQTGQSATSSQVIFYTFINNVVVPKLDRHQKTTLSLSGTISTIYFPDYLQVSKLYPDSFQITFYVSTSQSKIYYVNDSLAIKTIISPISNALVLSIQDNRLISFQKNFITTFIDVNTNNNPKELPTLFSVSYFNTIIDESQIYVPEETQICFIIINNPNELISNQLIGMNSNAQIIYLASFKEKISSVKANRKTRRIFIGFQNGQIQYGSFSPDFQIKAQNATNIIGLQYSKALRGLISYNNTLQIFDLYSQGLELKDVPKTDNKIELSGIEIDEVNKCIIYYSKDRANYLYKQKMRSFSKRQIEEASTNLKEGPSNGLTKVFMDIQNQIIIGYCQPLNEIHVWDYINEKKKHSFDLKTLIQKPASPEANNEPYSIIQYYFNKQNQTIFILDSQDQFISYYYKTNKVSILNLPYNVDKFFYDQIYAFLIIKTGYGLQSTLKIYNSTFFNIMDKQDHQQDIRDVLFVDIYTLSYDKNNIVVLDRKFLTTLKNIKVINPIILNLIVSVKLDMIFIWNDYNIDQINYQKIAIFSISTGNLFKEVSANQQLEFGNIGQVTLDESSYTLFFSRSNQFIQAFDLLRFVYSGYYYVGFGSAISNLIFIPEFNIIVCNNSTTIQYFQVENSLNSRNLVTPLYESKNDNNFMISEQKKLHFMDGDSSQWVFDNNLFKLSFLEQQNNILIAKVWKNCIYLATVNELKQYTSDFQFKNSIKYKARNLFFSEELIFSQNEQFKLQKIKIKDLTFVQFDDKFAQASQIISQLCVIEELKEIFFIIPGTYYISMHNYQKNTSKEKYTDLKNITFFLENMQQKFIIVFTNQTFVLSVFHSITSSSSVKADDKFYSNLLQKTTSQFPENTTKIYKATYDNQTKRLYGLSSNGFIIVYKFIFSKEYKLTQIDLDGFIPLPTWLDNIKLRITDTQLIIQMTWQLHYYDKNSFTLMNSIRDNNILNNMNMIIQIQGLDISQSNYYFICTNNYLQFVQMFDSGSLEIIYQFKLSYPSILNYQVDKISNKITVLGISNGLVFKYNFKIPIQQNALQQKYECYFNLGQFKLQYEQKNLLDKLKVSLDNLKIRPFKSLIIGSPLLTVYYDPVLKELNSVYFAIGQNRTDNARQTLNLNKEFFEPESYPQINLQNFNFNISQAERVGFNKTTQKITFSKIDLLNNGANFSFDISNKESVILEDININNIQLKGQSILFNINQCKTVYIKNLNIENIHLFNKSIFLVANKIQDLYIENLMINNTVIDESFQLNSIIFIQSSRLVQIKNFKINNTRSMNHMYFFEAYGNGNLILENVQFNQAKKVSFLKYSNQYQQNEMIFIQKNDFFKINSLQAHFIQDTSYPLISIEGFQFEFISLKISNVTCNRCFGSVLFVSQIKDLLLSNSKFISNLGLSGGVIVIQQCYYNQTKIENSTFENNTALSYGGAIYLENSNLQMSNNTIRFNQALIGGGIRYTGIQPDFINIILNKNRQLKDQINTIQKNNATIHSKNYGSFTYSLSLESNYTTEIQSQNDTLKENNYFIIKEYDINEFQSGGYINFKFQILDVEGESINFSNDSVEFQKYPSEIIEEIVGFKIKAFVFSEEIKIYGQYITDYLQFDMKSNSFKIKDMNIVSLPESSYPIYFEVPSIKRAHNKDGQYYFTNDKYAVKVTINFRKCIIGEIYKQSGSLFLCQECKQGFYSIELPMKNLSSTQACKRCPEQAEYCYRNQMKLFTGYWKVSNDTDLIVQCKNRLENCNGDEEKGYCKIGHMGPLCEQCDTKGEIWGARYMTDGKFNCIDCTGLQKDIKFILPSLFVGIFMVLYMIFSVKIALDISQLIVTGYYLRKLHMICIGKSAYQDTTNMNMKAMMNYMQISQLINTFEVDLPEFLKIIPQYIGSPVNNFMFTLDCYFSTFSSDEFPLIFLRTVWSLVLPALYLICMGLIYFILVKFKITDHRKSYIICGLVFMIFFLQPNMVQNLLSVMSCRKIDQQSYILADISYTCYTKSHIQFIIIVCIPGLLLWGFVFPLFIMKKLFQYRKQLDNALIRVPYGFLYQDYKSSSFYWEFIKSYMKLIIVVILNFYGDPYNNKLVIIMILLLIYQVALVKMKPYYMKYFQILEKKSMVVLTVITIMNIFLYNKPDIIQQQIFYIIVLAIHNIYLLYLIYEVVKAKLSVAQKQNLDYVKKKIIQYIPCFSKLIQIPKSNNLRVFHNWNKIRFEIMKFSQCKSIKKQKEVSEIQQLIGYQSAKSPQSMSVFANIASCDNLTPKDYSAKNLDILSAISLVQRDSKNLLDIPSANQSHNQSHVHSHFFRSANSKSLQYVFNQNKGTKLDNTDRDIILRNHIDIEINEINNESSNRSQVKSKIQLHNFDDDSIISYDNISDKQQQQQNTKTKISKFNSIYRNLSKIYSSSSDSSPNNIKIIPPNSEIGLSKKLLSLEESNSPDMKESKEQQSFPRKTIHKFKQQYEVLQDKFNNNYLIGDEQNNTPSTVKNVQDIGNVFDEGGFINKDDVYLMDSQEDQNQKQTDLIVNRQSSYKSKSTQDNLSIYNKQSSWATKKSLKISIMDKEVNPSHKSSLDLQEYQDLSPDPLTCTRINMLLNDQLSPQSLNQFQHDESMQNNQLLYKLENPNVQNEQQSQLNFSQEHKIENFIRIKSDQTVVKDEVDIKDYQTQNSKSMSVSK